MVTALVNVYKISHIKTTTYHPQGNGQVERTNQTLKNILVKITPASGYWSHYLPSALSVIWNTCQASTKFSPSELLYGFPMRHHYKQEEDATTDPKDPEEYAQEEFSRCTSVNWGWAGGCNLGLAYKNPGRVHTQ